MRVFADTSGLFALLVRDDCMHVRARENFTFFARNRTALLTSSFVLVETIALLQRRVGLAAVHSLQSRILPLLEILWVDDRWYARALQRQFATNSRDISLVDCLSFEIMESKDIRCAFTFDRHFTENGFEIAAFHDLDAR